MAADSHAAVGRSPEPSTTTPLTRETVSGQNPPAPDGVMGPLSEFRAPRGTVWVETTHGPGHWASAWEMSKA